MRLLVVEDNPTDVLLLQEALRAAGHQHEPQIARDGEEAMERLRAGGDPPDLVLLDLNLPRKNGREVLAEVKGDPQLRCIPVIVLTSSAAVPDIDFAYRHHANAYVRKPLGLERLTDFARALRDFWHGQATLPYTTGEAG
jgi:chemotaxis family two-component system response regulator Rcp1